MRKNLRLSLEDEEESQEFDRSMRKNLKEFD